MKKITKKVSSKIKKGKIIVIDGIDGSGKKTQTELLVKTLQKAIKTKDSRNKNTKKLYKKYNGVVRIDFPQYEKNFFGKFLKNALTQEEFSFLKVHPKIASVIYAADRWETLKVLNNYLDKNYIIVLDRYISSNQIHQGGKVKDEIQRQEFMLWLSEMEHKIFNLPKPNLILYLSLKFETSRKLVEERAKKNNESADLVEKDLEYQKNSRESALKLSTELKNMKVIECDDNNEHIKSREEIAENIFKLVSKII
jgi:dTMP kinase